MPTALVTGAEGFLGKHLVQGLNNSGYHVIKLGRSSHNDIQVDLRYSVPVLPDVKIDLLVHAAGKAHIVPKTDEEKRDFFSVNVQGTQNLLQAFDRQLHSLSAIVYISTVAVYGADEGENIKEQFPLAGNTPYALSKIEAEKMVNNWSVEHDVPAAVLRLPLIAGLGAPGNLGAMADAIQKGRYFHIGDASARKSIVLAEDVANALPAIAGHSGTFNLTDGYHPSFGELANYMAKQLQKPSPKHLPLHIAKLFAFAGNLLGRKSPINSDKLKKITSTLTFDDSLAKHTFSWTPQRVLDQYRIYCL